MGMVGLVMLLALGALGVASWLRLRKPETAGPLAALESIGGWVGLVGLLWGVFGLVQWIGAIGALSTAPLAMGIALLTVLATISLSLILAMPTVKSLAGSNGLTLALDQAASRLGGFKLILGFTCLGLAAWSLVGLFT